MILAMNNFEIFLFFCLPVSIRVMGATQGKDKMAGEAGRNAIKLTLCYISVKLNHL